MKVNAGELLDKAMQQVAASRKSLRSGLVDLSPVEHCVRAYCDALNLLPLEEAREHAPHLRELAEAMNALEHELEQARALVKERLQGLSTHKKANHAYRKSDGIGEKFTSTKEEE